MECCSGVVEARSKQRNISHQWVSNVLLLRTITLSYCSPMEGKTPKDLLEGNNWDGTSPDDEPGMG